MIVGDVRALLDVERLPARVSASGTHVASSLHTAGISWPASTR